MATVNAASVSYASHAINESNHNSVKAVAAVAASGDTFVVPVPSGMDPSQVPSSVTAFTVSNGVYTSLPTAFTGAFTHDSVAGIMSFTVGAGGLPAGAIVLVRTQSAL